MASNPTPRALDELIAAGEDLCDGLTEHAVAINVKQNTFAATRADLDALLAARNATQAADGAKPDAYTQLRTAESNAKGFLARAIKLFSITLGDQWSDAWLATGLPDHKVGIPGTQDARFAATGSIRAYLAANPSMENADPNVNVTAALGDTLYEAFSDKRHAVDNAVSACADAHRTLDEKKLKFSERYRATIEELDKLLSDDDPKWYDFGLHRPSDPSVPGVPSNVHATPLSGGHVLVVLAGARRANSFDYYKKVIGTDAAPVKVTNSPATQYTIDNLPAGSTVEITVTGVNAGGEGRPSTPVTVVVA